MDSQQREPKILSDLHKSDLDEEKILEVFGINHFFLILLIFIITEDIVYCLRHHFVTFEESSLTSELRIIGFLLNAVLFHQIFFKVRFSPSENAFL